MASLRRQTVLELVGGLKAFVNLELGVTRGQVPGLPEKWGKARPGKPLQELRREAFLGTLETLKTGRLLDLGCGKGGFALAARDLGWEVTAVDSQAESMPPAPGIDWVRADISRFEVGDYECIRLYGALYDLGPREQLGLLQRCSGSPTVIEARVLPRPDREEHGYEGRTVEGSFWPTEKALIRMARDSGFSAVSKIDGPRVPDRSLYLCT